MGTQQMTRADRILKFYRDTFTYRYGPWEAFFHALTAFVEAEVQIAVEEALKQKESA